MKTILLDTNVLIRFLNDDEPFAEAIESADAIVIRATCLRRKAGDSFRVSNLVLSEVYDAMQHHYGVDKKTVLVIP